ncbi:lipoprotein, putative [Roseibacterium elongatum DSM 19469]|uniref:Lipoprotein, putative n=1 Tax=Roseicyclus elongatus DSM 19469 TaxID=1294273 RepID=W8RVQ9_9RHOB|nr:hypothetical protein [Roseibacterium elongatum]AHM05373.1 lipoprotein, putative [Roseibacterium elongatum DSM 19469]
MARFSRLTLCALLGADLSGLPLQAATIETTVTPDMEEMGCTLRLAGELAPGDLEALSAVLSDPPPMEASDKQLPFSPALFYGFPYGTHRLCLNSSGGDIDLALRIAEALDRFQDEYGRHGIPTAVAAGDRCDGACGLIFMAGRYSWQSYNEGYWRVDRVLHPQGHLSLPALNLWQTDNPRMTFAGLSRLMAERAVSITPGLLADMLAYTADDVLPVDTVGAASQYAIEVAPIAMAPVLTRDLDALRANGCANAALMLQGRFSLSPPDAPDWETRALSYEDPDRVLDFVGSVGGYPGLGSALSEPREYSCAAVSSFLSDGMHEYLGTDPAVHEDAYHQMRGDGYGSLGFVEGQSGLEAFSPFEPDFTPDIGPVEIGPLQLLAPQTPLSEL